MTKTMDSNDGKWHELVAIGGTIIASLTAAFGVCALAWKRVCLPVVKYLRDFASMPSNVCAIRQDVVTLDTLVRHAHEIAEGKFEILFADVRRPIWESDAQGACIRCNRKMLDVLGRAFSEIQGHNWRSIIADEDRERVMEEWDNCVKYGRTFEMSYSWVHKTGKLIPISATGIIIKDAKTGGLLRVVGIVTIK